MITGCAPPKPMPRMNEINISTGTVFTSGNRMNPVPVTTIAKISICHSVVRCTKSGSSRRTTKTAMPNAPRSRPICDADSPMREPWMGTTKVNRSHDVDSAPLTMKTRRMFGMRKRSIRRLLRLCASMSSWRGMSSGLAISTASAATALPASSRKVPR